MKNILFILLFIISVGILSSCEDSFLEIKNDEKVNSGSFPARFSDVEKELGATYGFRSGRIWNFPQVMASFGMEHFMFDSKPDRFPSAMTNGLNYIVNEPELWGENLFVLSYDNIKRENSLMADIERYKPKAAENVKEMLDFMLGEAYVSRAVEYFYLAGFYGETIGDDSNAKGMILIDKIAESRKETFKGRSTVKETYDFIISDLKKGIELLGDHEWPEGMRGRFTGIGAKALLGKVYVYLKRWPEAVTTLSEVVNNPKVKLASTTSFKNMWVDGGPDEFNGESLLQINNTNTVQDSWWGGTNQGTERMYGTAYWKNNAATGTGSWNMGFYPDANIERFGYKQDHWTKPMDQNYIDVAIAKRAAAIPDHDPRLFMYAYQPWVDQITADDGKSYPVSYPAEGLTTWWDRFHTFALKKYTYTVFKDGTYGSQTRVNEPIIRVADVYLLYAEALINSGGSSATALEYINKVHRRAYGFDVNASSPVDYASLTSPTKAPSDDQVCGNNPLMYERWAELQGENSWFFDIKRYRLGPKESAYYGHTTALGTWNPIVWNDRYYAWPFPQNEINTSNGLVVQNTGF